MRAWLATLLAVGCAAAPVLPAAEPAPIRANCGDPFEHRSRPGGARQAFALLNASTRPISFFWNDEAGGRHFRGTLPSGEAIEHISTIGHVFVIATLEPRCVGTFELRDGVQGFVVTDASIVALDAVSRAEFERARETAYRRFDRAGELFFISRNALEHPKETESLLALLTDKARAARARLSPRWRQAVASVAFWIEWERNDTSEFRYLPRKNPATSMENPRKWGGVEVTSVRRALHVAGLTQPWVVAHELMHAIHDQLPSDERARLEQLYVAARTRARNPDGYTFRDASEYFANRGEAWVGVAAEAPATAAELRELEPAMAAFLEAVLGPPPPPLAGALAPCVEPPLASAPGLPITAARWENRLPYDVELWWVNPDGTPESPSRLKPGGVVHFRSRVGHVTLVRGAGGRCLGTYTAAAERSEVILGQ